MFLETFIVLLFQILQFAILIRVIMTWVSPNPRRDNPLIDFLWQITEPILAPIRRFGTFGMLDLSPIIALILLRLVEQFILQAVRSAF